MKYLSEEEKTTTELYRKFRAILNKLTPQKFQTLAEQAVRLTIDTEERLKGVIDIIFTKVWEGQLLHEIYCVGALWSNFFILQALEEPMYSSAYANLCRVLSPVKVEWTQDRKTKFTTFRRVLLTKCQQEFEKDKRDDETREEMMAAIENAKTVRKTKAILWGLPEMRTPQYILLSQILTSEIRTPH